MLRCPLNIIRSNVVSVPSTHPWCILRNVSMACRRIMRGGCGPRSRSSILNYATMTGHLLFRLRLEAALCFRILSKFQGIIARLNSKHLLDRKSQVRYLLRFIKLHLIPAAFCIDSPIEHQIYYKYLGFLFWMSWSVLIFHLLLQQIYRV